MKLKSVTALNLQPPVFLFQTGIPVTRPERSPAAVNNSFGYYFVNAGIA